MQTILINSKSRDVMSTCLVLDARTATAHFPGIGRYVVNLTRTIVSLLGEDEQLVLLRDSTQPSPWNLTRLARERVQVMDVPVSPFSLPQQWVLPRLLSRCLEADLYHSPYYLMPYQIGVPTVVTVHDLIPLLYPQYVSAKARLLFRWMMALALRAAAHIIAISQTTRRDLVASYRLSPQKVTAISLAVDSDFYPQPPTEVERVHRKYALTKDYILYLGINKPHRNLIRLIDAFLRLTPHASRLTLVIAGPWDSRYPEPRHRVATLGLEKTVRFLGLVPEADLPALYAGAALFVVPSLYEGFGLPALEAMTCGAPVACSNTSNLPDVAGDAAL